MRPVCVSRTSDVFSDDGDLLEREAGDVRVAAIELLLHGLKRRGAPANSAAATVPLTLAAGMPDPASAVSNDIGTVWPAFGERGPVTTSSAFAPRCRAAMRLVAKVGVAREDRRASA